MNRLVKDVGSFQNQCLKYFLFFCFTFDISSSKNRRRQFFLCRFIWNRRVKFFYLKKRFFFFGLTFYVGPVKNRRRKFFNILQISQSLFFDFLRQFFGKPTS